MIESNHLREERGKKEYNTVEYKTQSCLSLVRSFLRGFILEGPPDHIIYFQNT